MSAIETYKYNISIPGSYSPKIIRPIVQVLKPSGEIKDIVSFTVNRSANNAIDTFNIKFKGQAHYSDLEFFKDIKYTIKTGYHLDSQIYTKELISGYANVPRETISPNGVDTTCSFLTAMRNLKYPYSEKSSININLSHRLILAGWEPGDPITGGGYSSQKLVQGLAAKAGISVRYNAYSYSIAFYQIIDYSLPIIKDLIEFTGGFLRYNTSTGVLEILEKYSVREDGADFYYTDYGDIYSLDINRDFTGFANSVLVEGVFPDDELDLKDAVDTEAYPTGSSLAPDGDHYLMDVVQGMEKAPPDPYIDTPPSDLIEKKFYNIHLHFAPDPDSIQIEGGSLDYKTGKYEGAKFLGYGGFLPSSAVLTAAETVFSGGESSSGGASSSRPPLMPGEGLVGTPWRYEEVVGPEFTETDGIYQYGVIRGKVIDSVKKEPISGAIVEAEFNMSGNVWQYWRYQSGSSQLIVRLYLPAGTVSLGPDWEDVTASYPSLAPPSNIPATVNSDVDGIFEFSNVPISQYDITGIASGFEQNEIEIELDQEALDLLSGIAGPGDKPKKYKLIDTVYHIPVYAKRWEITFGSPTEEPYSEESAIVPKKYIALDVRHHAGIAFIGNVLYLNSKVIDPRIISMNIGKKAGLALIREAENKGNTRTISLPHNPDLKPGMTISIKSALKGWAGLKLWVRDITTTYSITNAPQEKLRDVVVGVPVI